MPSEEASACGLLDLSGWQETASTRSSDEDGGKPFKFKLGQSWRIRGSSWVYDVYGHYGSISSLYLYLYRVFRSLAVPVFLLEAPASAKAPRRRGWGSSLHIAEAEVKGEAIAFDEPGAIASVRHKPRRGKPIILRSVRASGAERGAVAFRSMLNLARRASLRLVLTGHRGGIWCATRMAPGILLANAPSIRS